VAIAEDYSLDGWLINIENKLDIIHIQNLLKFLNILTKEMKKINSNSKVIWYDAVTIEGNLQWQDSLTNKNKLFFDNCDGIFINYTWKDVNLLESSILAESRINDIYFGCDVWGRGTPGRGGYDTYKAVELINQYNLSVALFAPGWILETQINELGT
jgi:mannosyl-glycoprotein endo-beta-N-acetylglucosaminidase